MSIDVHGPYTTAPKGIQQGFLRHMGASDFFAELTSKGARTDVDAWIRLWETRNKAYQTLSKRHWLYQ